MEDLKGTIKKRFKLFDDKKYVLIIIAIFFAAVFVFYGKKILTAIPYFHVKNIHIEGNRVLNKTDIIKILQVNENDSVIMFDSKKAEQRFIKSGLVKQIKVTTLYPNTIKVFLRERYPISYARIIKNNRMEYRLIDDDGIIISQEVNNTIKGIPLIIIDEIDKYDKEKLNENLKKTLYTLSVIFYNAKSDIKLINKIWFEPRTNKVHIWIKDEKYKFVVKDFLKVKDFLEIKNLIENSVLKKRNLRIIDLRFDDIIAR
jgi:hypothetical protein